MQSAATASSRAAPTLTIRPPGRVTLGVRELWGFRELLYFLTWRDLKVRYKQTLLGAAWAVLQPVLMMLIFTLFFGRLAKVGSQGVPYPVFAYAGLLPWLFFANSLQLTSNSLVGSAALITKVYFPRLILALSPVLAALVDFVLAFGVLVILMGAYDVGPVWPRLALLPAFLALAFVTVVGVGALLAALNVKYRDVRYVVPFLTQIWLFATPVVYPASLVHGTWRTVYGLNPMVGVVDGFRWVLIGTPGGPLASYVASAAVAVALLAAGVLYFRRTEREFADIV